MKFENKSKNNKMDNLDVSYENLKQTCDEKNNKINKECYAKGITLIALVVTIVVMLVLAGVSINLLTGDNGAITKAKQAKMKSEFATYNEELELFNTARYMENPEYSIGTLTAGKSTLNYNTNNGSGGSIKEILTSISDEYLDKVEIIKGEIYINTKNKMEIEVAQEMGIKPNPYDIKDGILLSSTGNLLLMDETGTVTIPDSVKEIGSGAFSKLTGLKKIVIPGTVKKISSSAFAFNSTLEEVILGYGIEEIGDHAFNGCTNLKTVQLPQSLTTIASLAFYQCSNLESINIPSTVQNIGTYVFSGCRSLNSVIIEEGVTKLTAYEFDCCTSLTSITIPSTVTDISATAFVGCTGLSKITLINNKNYVMREGMLKTSDETQIIFITDATLKKSSVFVIPENTTKFEADLYGYNNITQIQIPASLAKLGSAIRFPKTVNSVIVNPGNTTYVSENGILYTKDDKKLIMCYSKEKDIKIPEGMLGISSYSFWQASNAENVTLPDSLVSIENGALQYGDNYKKIHIGKNTSDISPTFKVLNYNGVVEIDSGNEYYTIKDNILYSKDGKTLVCALYKVTGKLEIPQGVEKIKNAAFDVQKNVEEVIIQEGLKIIERDAFSQCDLLKRIEIPSSVTTIGVDCFERCSSLESIEINKEKGSIEGSAWSCPMGERAVKWLK